MHSLAPPPAGGALGDRLACLCLETVLIVHYSIYICIYFPLYYSSNSFLWKRRHFSLVLREVQRSRGTSHSSLKTPSSQVVITSSTRTWTLFTSWYLIITVITIWRERTSMLRSHHIVITVITRWQHVMFNSVLFTSLDWGLSVSIATVNKMDPHECWEQQQNNNSMNTYVICFYYSTYSIYIYMHLFSYFLEQ